MRRKRAGPPAAPAPVQPGLAEAGSPQGDPQEGGPPGEEALVGEGPAAAEEPAADAATPRSPAVEGEAGTVADDGSDDGSAPLARAKSRDPFEEMEDEEVSKLAAGALSILTGPFESNTTQTFLSMVSYVPVHGWQASVCVRC